MKQQSQNVPDRHGQATPSNLLIRLLKLPQVIEATKLQRSSIYKKVSEHTFPAPIKLGLRSVAWETAAVEKWIDDRISDCRSSVQGGA